MSYSFEHAKAKLDNIDLPIYLPIALSHEVMPEIQEASSAPAHTANRHRLQVSTGELPTHRVVPLCAGAGVRL